MLRRAAAVVAIWLSLATLAWGAVIAAIVVDAPAETAAFVGVCALVAYILVRARESAGRFNSNPGGNRNGR